MSKIAGSSGKSYEEISMNHKLNPRRFPLAFLALSVLLLFAGCSGLKSGENTTEGGETTAVQGLQPIDIRSSKFFWLVQPWKEGKLATIDGWGRFAEISFIGADKIQIKQLVEFPRTQLDRELITWPDAGLITSRIADKMHHLAAIDDNKTKSHVPLLTWRHYISEPVLLDAREGLVGYCYSLRDEDVVDKSLLVYNYKEDKMVYESPKGFSISLEIAMNDRYILCYQGSYDGNKKEEKEIFYDWRTTEIVENDLTKTITRNRIDVFVGPYRNINLSKRYLFGYNNIIDERVKITWDEEYSDIKVTPLHYLVPGKWLSHFILSADGTWASTLVGGYRGLYNENLCKRAFFHLDDRYPNGISMAIITNDYEKYKWEYSAFVQHPVHGLCYAQEWHKEKKLYLRLYKMDDVLAEINRKLLEAAEKHNSDG